MALFRGMTGGLVFLLLFTQCRNKDTEPEYILPPPADTIALDIVPSTFNIPITYSLESLESYINHKLNGEFLETIIRPENKKHLEIDLKLSRTSAIQLSSHAKEIVCIVPIKAEATILNSGMNILTKGLKPVEAEVVLELHTPASLDANWNLVTDFDLVKTTWVETPKLKVLGINFDLQKTVDKLLTEDKSMLTSLLNEEINQGVSLEKAIGKVWYDLQKPIPVSKEEPYLYLKFICDSIAGRFILGDTSITCLTSIKAQVGILTDTTHSFSLVNPLPAFSKNYEGDSLSNVHLHLIVGFEEINKELNEHLAGRKFKTGGMSLKIRDIRVHGSELGMIIRLKSSGAINGELMATATPFFDSTFQLLSFKEFDFKVVTNNAMLQVADLFLHNMIRDSIQAGLGLELNSVLSKVPDIISGAIAKGKTGKTLNINVSDMRMSSCVLVLDSKNIHLDVHTYFLADILLKHINPGKTLRIHPTAESETGRR